MKTREVNYPETCIDIQINDNRACVVNRQAKGMTDLDFLIHALLPCLLTTM
jgi:hypothetical protein